MSGHAIVALTAKDFDDLDIGVQTIGWIHGELCSQGGWMIHGEPRHLRVLAAALSEAAGKAEAAQSRTPAAAS